MRVQALKNDVIDGRQRTSGDIFDLADDLVPALKESGHVWTPPADGQSVSRVDDSLPGDDRLASSETATTTSRRGQTQETIMSTPNDRDPKPPSESIPKQGDSKPGQNTEKPVQGDTKRPA